MPTLPPPTPIPGWQDILQYLQNLPKAGSFPQQPVAGPTTGATLTGQAPQQFPYQPPVLAPTGPRPDVTAPPPVAHAPVDPYAFWHSRMAAMNPGGGGNGPAGRQAPKLGASHPFNAMGPFLGKMLDPFGAFRSGGSGGGSIGNVGGTGGLGGPGGMGFGN